MWQDVLEMIRDGFAKNGIFVGIVFIKDDIKIVVSDCVCSSVFSAN